MCNVTETPLFRVLYKHPVNNKMVGSNASYKVVNSDLHIMYKVAGLASQCLA